MRCRVKLPYSNRWGLIELAQYPASSKHPFRNGPVGVQALMMVSVDSAIFRFTTVAKQRPKSKDVEYITRRITSHPGFSESQWFSDIYRAMSARAPQNID
jgi:hypothetical protein